MSTEIRITPEEAVSPQAAFDSAIKSLNELDARSLDIATHTGSKPIHDVFEGLVNDPSLVNLRVLDTKRNVVGIKSPDQRVTIHHSNDGLDSARSGIEIVTISSEQFARGSKQVEMLNLVNIDGRYHSRNWPENYASVSVNEVFPKVILDSVLLGEKVSAEKTPTTRPTVDIKDPAVLIQQFLRGLEHARKAFVK